MNRKGRLGLLALQCFLLLQSAGLTVSSFSRAGMDASLAAQEGSDQLWSCVISNSSAVLRTVKHRFKACVLNLITSHFIYHHILLDTTSIIFHKHLLFCEVFTCVRISERTGAKAVVWSSRVRACSTVCLRSPRPGQGKTRGRLEICFWRSDRRASAWPRWHWQDTRRSTRPFNCLMGDRRWKVHNSFSLNSTFKFKWSQTQDMSWYLKNIWRLKKGVMADSINKTKQETK